MCSCVKEVLFYHTSRGISITLVGAQPAGVYGDAVAACKVRPQENWFPSESAQEIPIPIPSATANKIPTFPVRWENGGFIDGH
jgi:hypothetical protein